MSNSFDDIQKSLLWDIYYADGLQWFSNGMACTALYLAKSVSLLVFTLYLFLFVALYQIVRKKFVLPRIGYSKLRIGADRSRTKARLDTNHQNLVRSCKCSLII